MAEVRRRLAGRRQRHAARQQRRDHVLRASAGRDSSWTRVQIVLSDPHYWGGIRNQQHLSKFCEVLGMGLSMHSNNHLGVSMMTMAHASAACPHLTYACDTHYPWQTEQDEVVLGGRVPIVNGCVRIPDKPGLGVELDYDQLARGRERYDEDAVSQARRRGGNAAARRSQLEAHPAAVVSSRMVKWKHSYELTS